ncbi:MAG: hypothetical protein QNL80_10200 [Akkermansiaceae bacterium]
MRSLLILFISASFLQVSPAQTEFTFKDTQSARPNIVMIMADEQ